MALDIYGGDAKIIATRDELLRISGNLMLAASQLHQAPLAMPSLFLDFLPNPLPNLQLAVQLPPVIEQLDRLSNSCQVAAESYFSTEAQINHILQDLFRPLSDAAGLLPLANPISAAMSDIVARTGAALAIVGLVAGPSAGGTQLVAQGARVIANAAGHQTPAAMLAAAGPSIALFGGSAQLLSSSSVQQRGTLGSVTTALREGYWSPSGSVRIQSFAEGSGRALLVLIPGTQNFSPLGSNPLNLSSNLGAFAGVGSPSQAAVSAALKQVGAGPTDRVIFVGHSQGGIIGANLAARPQPYQVAGLITLGSPVSQLDLRIPTISIQHQQDPIPLLSGTTNPMRENWVTISSGSEFENLVQAHHIASYAETASQAVLSDNPGLSNVLQQMNLPEGEATEYLYRLSRD